jgi:hypothetical protein
VCVVSGSGRRRSSIKVLLVAARGMPFSWVDEEAEVDQFILANNMPEWYYTSDDAGQCARARCFCALRFPWMTFFHCFDHKVNLIGIFLKSTLAKLLDASQPKHGNI